MTEKMSRREMVGTVIRATAGLVILPTTSIISSCLMGHEKIGPQTQGRNERVWETTLRDLGEIFWIDRRYSGRKADGSLENGGPRILELRFYEEHAQWNRGQGELVFTIDDGELYEGAHIYKAQPHQVFQWYWGPQRREPEDDELTEPGMPSFDRNKINEIENRVGFYGEVD